MHAGALDVLGGRTRARVGYGPRGRCRRASSRLRHRRAGADRRDPWAARARRAGDEAPCCRTSRPADSTEIDVINGAVVPAAGDNGVAVPINRALLWPRQGLGVAPGSRVSTRLTYFGAAGYEIVGPSHRILIDPFLSENPRAPAPRMSSSPPTSSSSATRPSTTTATRRASRWDRRARRLRYGRPGDADRRGRVARPGERDDLGHRRRNRRAAAPARRVPPLVLGHALGRPPDRRQSDRVHRRDRARRPHLPLRRHVHLRHAPDRRALQADRRAARLHVCRRNSRTGSPGRATFLTGEMDADEAARTAEMLGARPRGRLPLPGARRARSNGSWSSCRVYDTSGRRRVVAPLVGETLVVDGERHSIEGRVV